MPDLLRTLGEILLFSLFFYFVLRFLEGSRGAGILKGLFVSVFLVIVVVSYLADRLGFVVIAHLLGDWTFGALFLAAIVLFQPEMRRAFVRLGQNPVFLPVFRSDPRVVREVVQSAVRLAKARVGALIAIEREVGLGSYADGGVGMNCEISAELIETIFYPGSALHDGAIVIRNERIAAAGCLFPLTDNPDVSKSIGTRHRAAIGLTEETDAVTIVVSEETGQISLCVRGQLTRDLDRDSLERVLRDLYVTPDRPERRAGPEAAASFSFF